MYLNRKDIEKLRDVLAKFPDVENFELVQDSSSGIGSVTTVIFTQNVNGYTGRFEVEISGVEDW